MIFISILIFIVAIALPSFKKQLSPILLLRVSSIIMIYAGVLSFNALYIQSIGSGIGIYSGLFHVTAVSQQLDTFLLFIGALILIPRPGILEFVNKLSTKNITNINLLPSMPNTDLGSGLGGKYSLVVLFSTLGSLLLMSCSDLLSMYLSIELQSFGLYILATLFRDSKSATSAGLKYFLLGGLSSCIILLGAGLVYTFTGLTNLESIYSLLSVSHSKSISQGFTLGLILIMIGFLFKIAAAPLHHWAPDVYDDSPTIVTIWLTIIPKIAILVFILDLFIGGISINLSSIISNTTDISISKEDMLLQPYELIKNLLLLSSLLSLIVGTVVGLAQSKIKRLLAYSTISHIGFILLALAVNTEQSIESFIFYIIQYSLTNLDIFLIILALGYLIKYSGLSVNSNIESKDIRFISELKGQFMSNPLLSISLSICLFSLAGIPPLMGFFSKQMVLYSALQSGYYFISIVAIIVSVISASYYLKIVRILFSESNSHTNNNDSNVDPTGYVDGQHFITNSHSFLISSLTLIILFFILKPSLLLNSTQLLSLTLYHC